MPIKVRKQFGPMFIPNLPQAGDANSFIYEIDAVDAEEFKELAKLELTNLKDMFNFMKEKEVENSPASMLEPKQLQKPPKSMAADGQPPKFLLKLSENQKDDITEEDIQGFIEDFFE